MKGLLSSFFSRLGKGLVFWLCLVLLAALAIRAGLIEVLSVRDQPPQDRWNLILFSEIYQELPAILAAFTALFLGREYDGGAMRNKLMAGCPRWKIYGAALITVSAAAMVMVLLYAGITAVLCWAAHGPMPDPSRVPIHLAAVLLLCVSWSALFTAIGLNCTKPAVSVVASLAVVWVLFVFCNDFLFRDLITPGHPEEPYWNRFLYDMLPAGQGDQLRDIGRGYHCETEEVLMSYSARFILLTTCVGQLLFWKKDFQ